MNTLHTPTKNVNPAARGRLPYRPLKSIPLMEVREEAGDLIVTLIDRRQTEYLVQSLSTDLGGCAFRWRKRHGDRAEYDVLANGTDSSCTCPGFIYGDSCKHIHAVFQLIEQGVLNVAPDSAGDSCEQCGDADY